MKTFDDYVNEIKDKKGITTNYAIAKLLLIDPKKMTEIMQGKRNPPPVTPYVIADVLGLDAREVCACLAYEQTKDELQREYLKSVFFRYSRHVAALFLAITIGVGAIASEKSLAGNTNKYDKIMSYYAN